MGSNVDKGEVGVVGNSDDVAPRWLWPLLSTSKLYSSCSSHQHQLRRRFCLTCMGEALCDICTRSHPQYHPILEVHKVSGFPSLRIDDVKKLMDESDIHPFIINHHRVVRLHRPEVLDLGKKLQVKDRHCCFNCSKILQDSNYRFCSIVCKIEAITRCGKESNLKTSLELPEENKGRMIDDIEVKSFCKKFKRGRRGIKSSSTAQVPVRNMEEPESTSDEVHKLPRKSPNENGACSIKKIRPTIRIKKIDEPREVQVPAPEPRRHSRKGIPVRASFF